MGRVLTNAKLERLPEEHVIFRFPHQVDQVTPRSALARRLNSQGRIAPVLFGVLIEGRLAVVYSPFDLSGGWALAHGPYNEGIANEDALGVNILAHALIQ